MLYVTVLLYIYTVYLVKCHLRAAQDQNDLNIEWTSQCWRSAGRKDVSCKDLLALLRRFDLSAQCRTTSLYPSHSPSHQDRTEARAEPTCGSQLHTSDWMFTYNLQLGNSWSIHLAWGHWFVRIYYNSQRKARVFFPLSFLLIQRLENLPCCLNTIDPSFSTTGSHTSV